MALGEQAEAAVLTMIRQGVDLNTLISEQARLPRVCPYKIGNQEWSWWIQEEEPRLAALGVIEPAEEGLWPTSSGFFVPKKSKFRLVLDLRPLNLLTPKEELCCGLAPEVEPSSRTKFRSSLSLLCDKVPLSLKSATQLTWEKEHFILSCPNPKFKLEIGNLRVPQHSSR